MTKRRSVNRKELKKTPMLSYSEVMAIAWAVTKQIMEVNKESALKLLSNWPKVPYTSFKDWDKKR